jgi:hypothetical protein
LNNELVTDSVDHMGLQAIVFQGIYFWFTLPRNFGMVHFTRQAGPHDFNNEIFWKK